MNNLLKYSVDGDTVDACLGIIERAAERARRGLPAVLGGARTCSNSRPKRQRQRPRAKGQWKAQPISAEQRRKVCELLRQGLRPAEVARAVGCSNGRVYWIRSSEGLQRRAA